MPVRSVRRDSIAAAIALALAAAGCAPVTTGTPGGRIDGPASSPPPGGRAPGATRGAVSAAVDPETQPASAAATTAPAPGGSAAAAPRGTIAPAALPGWADDDLTDLAGALDAQCAAARPPAPWPALCAQLRALPHWRTRPAVLRTWVGEHFVARALTDAAGSAEGLITGYHEPAVRGSRTRTAATQVPLYRRPPDDLLRTRPTRAEIESSGRFAGHELVWLDDPVEAFFLHVQGSGRVRLDDGRTLRVGYAGDNGHPYKAIGAVLVARGAMTAADANAGTIKAWLRANPAQAGEVLRANPRYIFFRELPPLPDGAGPPGSLGVPLTPMRSLAVDPKQVPPGSLMWLETTDPIDGAPLRRLVLAQDTGAAIVGPVRADLFWGTGARAELGAGLMKQRGRLWILRPLPGR